MYCLRGSRKVDEKKTELSITILLSLAYTCDTQPQGGYSGFQVTEMIEWSQKSRPKKIPKVSSKTQKNPWTNS